jgi:uncharacterized protein involved in outer membrane biogenesis
MRKGIIVKIGIVLAVMVAIVVIGAIIAIKSVNLDQIKEMLSTQVEKSTGRALMINGPVEMRLGLVPRVVVNDVTFSNPPGSSRPEMVKIKRFEMEVALQPLLNKEIMVNRLLLSSPDILIETEPNGPGNLEFKVADTQKEPPTASQTAADSGGSGFRFAINEIKIVQGAITLYDRSTQKSDRVIIELLDLLPNTKDATRRDLQLATRIREHTVNLSGTVGRIGTALTGASWPLQLKAVVDGITFHAEGSVADLPAFRGLNIALNAQGDELVEVLKKAGVLSPQLPSSLGPFSVSGVLVDTEKQLTLNKVEVRLGQPDLAQIQAKGKITNLNGKPTPDLNIEFACSNPAALAPIVGTEIPLKGPVTFTATVSGNEQKWHVRDISAMVGKSDIKGALEVHLGKRPLLIGQLSSRLLDVTDLTMKKSGSEGTTQAAQATATKGDGRLFSNQPLPLAPLRTLDTDLKVQVGQCQLESRQLQDVQAHIQLKDGRLTVVPFRFTMAGGVFEGTGHLDSGGKTPSLAVQINGRQFELGKLQDNGPISGGKSDLKVDLKGSGQSLRALMASLTGETVVSVGEGRLQNKAIDWAAGDLLFQVLGAINPFAKSEDTTKMECAVVRFLLRDGLATTNNGIAMRTNNVDVIGSGTVDLRTERLDLGIKPKARGGVGLSLSTPLAGLIRVNGTLARPSMGIDAVGTLKTAASIGAGVATGGLSTLGELLVEKVVADEDPCRTALGLKQAAQSQAQPKKEPQKPTPKDLLQGIFSR